MSEQEGFSQRLSQRHNPRLSRRFIIPGTRTRRGGVPITPNKDGEGPQRIEDFFNNNLSDDDFESPNVSKLTPSRPHHRFSLNGFSVRPDAIEGNDDNNEEDKDEGADVSTLDIPADNSDAEDIVSDTDGETTGDRLISSAATLAFVSF
ncbi:unnamed protein product [Ambrosiozyma monospora]|uniref:Unnamed protein product n=1 Tax=Ambrosiozyma monospora TaxID=43982 RepID=A0ACB5SX88_AMBMO|nr:unnamed protein product [Ambrosiozyma monospora]